MLKVVREPLILMHGGAVSRSYARGVQAVAIDRFRSGVRRARQSRRAHRLVNWINGFFIVSLAVFSGSPARLTARLRIFRVARHLQHDAIAQFWSLASDLFTQPKANGFSR